MRSFERARLCLRYKLINWVKRTLADVEGLELEQGAERAQGAEPILLDAQLAEVGQGLDLRRHVIDVLDVVPKV